MFSAESKKNIDLHLTISMALLMAVGIFIQISLGYIESTYLIFIFLAIVVFFVSSAIDFEFYAAFSKYFYVLSIILLIIPLLIGQATRGTIRWIPIGSFTLQPAEIVRPFLFLFAAKYLNSGKKNYTNIFNAALIFGLPTFLILIQPSLGVTILTSFGFLGVYLLSRFTKRQYLISFLIVLISLPIGLSLTADYQRQRLTAFLNPGDDPLGAGYNSIQSMISVGSGGFFGRGLGRGVQTQLQFLPERQSDFIFASVSEELGFVGSTIILLITFYLLYRIIYIAKNTNSEIASAYTGGLFLSFFAQIMIHVGMNLGLFPITGVPYPFLSAGGSSLIATFFSLGIVSSVSTTHTISSKLETGAKFS